MNVLLLPSGITTLYESEPPQFWGYEIRQKVTPQSVKLLWTSDQPVAETSTWKQHNTHKRQTSMPSAGFEPATSAADLPQAYALDRSATGVGDMNVNTSYSPDTPVSAQLTVTTAQPRRYSSIFLTYHAQTISLHAVPSIQSASQNLTLEFKRTEREANRPFAWTSQPTNAFIESHSDIVIVSRLIRSASRSGFPGSECLFGGRLPSPSGKMQLDCRITS
jgi:hypothetical protein